MRRFKTGGSSKCVLGSKQTFENTSQIFLNFRELEELGKAEVLVLCPGDDIWN